MEYSFTIVTLINNNWRVYHKNAVNLLAPMWENWYVVYHLSNKSTIFKAGIKCTPQLNVGSEYLGGSSAKWTHKILFGTLS
jgi:hypothetical protein